MSDAAERAAERIVHTIEVALHGFGFGLSFAEDARDTAIADTAKAIREELARDAPKWTSERPTEQGWYWCRIEVEYEDEADDDDADVLERTLLVLVGDTEYSLNPSKQILVVEVAKSLTKCNEYDGISNVPLDDLWWRNPKWSGPIKPPD